MIIAGVNALWESGVVEFPSRLCDGQVVIEILQASLAEGGFGLRMQKDALLRAQIEQNFPEFSPSSISD